MPSPSTINMMGFSDTQGSELGKYPASDTFATSPSNTAFSPSPDKGNFEKEEDAGVFVRSPRMLEKEDGVDSA